MKTYQQMILGHLETLTETDGTRPPVVASVAYDYANCGRVTVTRMATMKTIVTADFDFQTERVHIIFNNPRGPKSMMVSAAPQEDQFIWRIGNPEQDATVARLFERWTALLEKGLSA